MSCVVCNGKMPSGKIGKVALYCSNACRQRAYRMRTATQTAAPPLSGESVDPEFPEPPDAFIGREEQLDQIGQAVHTARLVTLVGPGGVGKTRLAVELARQPHGGRNRRMTLVELAPVPAGNQLTEAVATALGAHEQQGRTGLRPVIDVINSRRLELLLDNCEHLIADCAGLVAELLRSCPELTVLATSREPLEVPGEVVVQVDPLPVAGPAAGLTRRQLRASDAVRLFADRAQAADLQFTLTDDNVEAVAQLCHQLDGLPLAIELAARRVPSMPVHEIARCLEDQLDLLRQRSSAAGRRHTNLHETIDWSYRLLTPEEQSALCRLSLLPGGFDRAAAAAICGDDQGLHIVLSLHAKSLLQRSCTPGEPARFRMLETIRRYARDRLRESGDEAEAVAACVRWLVGLLSPLVYNNRFFVVFNPDWDANRDNMIAVLNLLPEEPVNADTRMLLAAAIARCSQARGRTTFARRLLADVIDEVPDSVNRPLVLVPAAWLAADQGDWREALRYAVEAVRLAREHHAPAVLGRALVQLGGALSRAGRLATCEQVLRQVLALALRFAEPLDVAKCRQNLAWLLLFAGSPEESLVLIRQALPVFRTERAPHELGSPLHTSACTLLRLGKFDEARAELLEVLEIGRVDWFVWPYAVDGLAVLAELEGDPVRALMLLAAAEAHREQLELTAEPLWLEWIDEVAHRAASALPPWEVAAAEQRGSTMSTDAVTRCATSGEVDEEEAADAPLTPREREVVTLLSDGMTNQQIAHRLTISSRTVSHHVENVKRKLDLSARSQVIRWYLESARHTP